MSKETLEKAYGNIPKEVPGHFDFQLPIVRGIKYYYYKLVRYFTR